MKRKTALVLLLVLALTGCKSEKTEPTAPPETQMPTEAEKPAVVGISMPEEAEPWQDAGTILCRELEAAGYTVTLVFGDGTAAGQEQQIAGLLEKQTDCLIVTPVDAVLPEKITDTLNRENIPLVAFDRPVQDTDAVSALVSFDYSAMGSATGQYLTEICQLQTAAETNKRCTAEFWMGSADNACASAYYTGLLAVLRPYLESGTLVCKTGRTAFEDTQIFREQETAVQSRWAEYRKSVRAGTVPDILCAGSDALAQKINETAAMPLGVLTGQGGTAEAIRQILAGKQTMTVYKDMPGLAELCARVAGTLIKTGKAAEYAVETDNHAKQVPTYLGSFLIIDRENYRENLIDTGIYTEQELAVE